MADRIRRVKYFYTMVPDRPREGAKVLDALRAGGVNLLAFHAFPEGGQAQLDFVAEDADTLREAADEAGIELTGPKTAFLVEGDDRLGAGAELLTRLGEANISVTAMDAVVASGRYGALFWVGEDDVERTAEALDAQ